MKRKRKRRDKLEIFYEILQECQNPTRLTQLMRTVSESYVAMKSFLKELEEKGFLDKRGIHWLTTEKGKEYIKRFEEIKRLLED